MVLVTIGVPVYRLIRQNSYKADTLSRMNKIGAAVKTYVAQKGGLLPDEDAKGEDSWTAAADPASAEVWYNALPKLAGSKPVSDYANSPAEFYTPANLLFLPGADYPVKRQLEKPYFAIAMNTKLQTKNPEGVKVDLKMSDITNPARTVLFLEQGLPGEARSMDQQTKKDYDGASKGSAKSFVARYRKKGWILFADGHAEDFAANELLTETARFPFPPGPDDVIWSRTAEIDPNKK
jgi:hypothetical protein